ncbi:MAG TPA: DUF1844 domain-containing protein [Syntrophobacteraceae bacterium]|nr:DUF1844 domain-containing protein [Syntrophobacteraceae bacterium]
MDEKEEKGFVIKDRRKVSGEDLDRQEKKGGGDEGREKEDARAKDEFDKVSRDDRQGEKAALPEVTLSAFIFSLSSSALVHLGEIPEPDTKATRVDLPMARQIIDTLGLLQEKTRGNLDPNEDRLLKSVLYDLRLRYVQKSKS